MEGGYTRLARLMPWAWPVLLTVLITTPLLAPGYVLGYDLVFVPDLTLRLDLFGVTTALPRAVPSDVLVAVLDELVGGQALNKLVLVAIPLLSGLGMTALWRSLQLGGPLAGAAATTLYVWNPFVAERFHLGAWALLLGYAALPWLVRGALKVRRGEGWRGFLLASAGCALTASGGITGLLLAAALLFWPSPRSDAAPQHTGGGDRRLRLLRAASSPSRVFLGAVLLNAPWLVAGLARTAAATSDPAAVPAFAARDEGYGGTLPTLLTLGGVWNADVVPGSRGQLVPVLLGFLLLLVAVVGVVIWWRSDRLALALVAAAVLAIVIAMAGVVAPGVLEWAVREVPGAGLFRDGQRYLGPLVLLESIGFGAAVAAVLGVARLKWVVGATAVLIPIAALPTLAGGDGLESAQYPADWAEARRVLAADDRPGAFIPWPFESYRAPGWNGRRPVLDPMPRYFTKPSIVPDELIVDGHRLAGEDPRATVIATALRSAVRDRTDPTAVLKQQGVGWLVVDREAGGPSPRDFTPQLAEVFAGPTVTVYSLPGAPDQQAGRPWAVVLVLLAWTLAGLVLVLAAVGGIISRGSSRRKLW
ncbi:hypothetical protein [Kribbella sp. CA-293567]|uniref:hypothetical protein n=1 Tax=Kribbella sp. CA-293567 TaxID=3002436 RepID=UPI0022DDE09F|nr:hypothetical protein [Kribbella sp. CA-293567]WBQ02385.1 hypothetical protein OX958_20600 [Kribbella sp. CA-293567]